MSEIDKNFRTFDILRSLFSHFPIEVVKYSFKNFMGFEFNFCWTFADILTPKWLIKYTSCKKTKIMKFSDPFGVFLKSF